MTYTIYMIYTIYMTYTIYITYMTYITLYLRADANAPGHAPDILSPGLSYYRMDSCFWPQLTAMNDKMKVIG